jgi:hypothetical protein
MTEWIVGTSNNITILTEASVLLQAYYMDEANTAQGYTPITGTWAIDLDRHIIPVTFGDVGRYTFKVIDVNGTIPALFQTVSVVDELSAPREITDTLLSTDVSTLTDANTFGGHIYKHLSDIPSLPLLADIKSEMINVQYGDLQIENNQLTIWDKQGNILTVFALFDDRGFPTMSAVYKREVV